MRVERDFYTGGVEVDAICYDPEIGTGKRLSEPQNAEDAGVAVVQGAHGVEEVRYHGCARGDGERGFFVGGFCVPDRVDYSSGCDFWDQAHHVRDFWRGGDFLDDGGTKGTSEGVEGGV